jgi:DNA-formamidopyrimidine glycosylase
MALLIGFGASAICPYLAFATIRRLCEDGTFAAPGDPDVGAEGYINAIKKGLLKTMSRIGISLALDELVSDLSVADQQLVDICRALTHDVKLVIMDAKVVVGVGNIYASEALFRSGILPRTAAKRISKARLAKLAAAIREVLTAAIAEGGTTLRDFLHSDGEPGYFRQRLFVYERKDQPCRVCGTPIRHAVIGQRSTYWCPQCQK